MPQAKLHNVVLCNSSKIAEEQGGEVVLTQTEVPVYGSGKLATVYPAQDN
jgi:hypothetical protein